ncbi:uncharacterized protein [Leptinotarsa decemlineata]|uniref:uncharacterized protein n=1 Tax=Leptinotarsa decemlineata TaxID=7539 RepID=UPI000C2537FC|nr:uncharacterized protein LOC111506947 [Leptinotarsa decemlineata]
MKGAIEDIVKKGIENVLPTDQVGFTFSSKDFAHGEGWMRFRPAREITFKDIWHTIHSIYQSNAKVSNTDTFCISITTVRMPAGKGRKKKYNTFEEECAGRHSLITINNKDNLCLPRALVVAMAVVDKDPEYVKVRRDTKKIQTSRARELMQAANVRITNEGCGISELEKFQAYLENYRIVVYNYGTKGRDIIFDGSNHSTKKLNLLYHKRHYSVIKSLTAAFSCVYFCEDCHEPYDHKRNHRCGKTCFACQQSPPCKENIRIKCADCQRSFRGQNCFENHKPKLCDEIRLCSICFKTVKRDRTHKCGEVFCKICCKHCASSHLCFMQPNTSKRKSDEIIFIFYDLETRQEKQLEDGSLLHETNLCVFKQACYICLGKNEEICETCGLRLQVLRTSDAISSFVKHILILRKKFDNVIVLAHNGQSFDHQFVLNYVLTKTVLKPKLIMRGTKIISMEIENVKFLDSLNYFPMSLAKLPQAFGLGDIFKKGYFPHLFNTKANETYCGPLPHIKYYSPDKMMSGDREKFLEWYQKHKDDVFDMKKEIEDYCISDVEILTAACLKFREQLLDATNVDPFLEASTIASACNKVFRRNFLKPETIGIIPKNGYRLRDKQSQIALRWLVWEEHQRSINIQHAAKGFEAIVSGVKVDGFCSETNQVFEFQGCYYHGHPKCLKYVRDKLLDNESPKETLNTKYERTVAKNDRIRELGYELIEKWECEFLKECDGNLEMIEFLKNNSLLKNSPLNPRDSFYGGRTGNTVEYYKVEKEEKIKYLDVCSLYPWVCKYGKFPIGHPKVYVGDECQSFDWCNMNGIIKCTILPPQNLFHPVLPMKMNDKLMFVLCQTCGETLSDECQHNTAERALTGTWVLDEVKKAREMGYEMLRIHEIWSYNITKFDKLAGTSGLFTEMMNKFVKIKQQASGWPKNCTEKDKYIEEFFIKEGIELDRSDIVENPGLRSLAKLMLNSFWGKLGQRENQPKTSIMNEPYELSLILTDPSRYVNSILPINEETVIVNWEYREESYAQLSTVNVAIAAFVTAQARLKLYSFLEKLGEGALYYDTDSVIFTHKQGEYEPLIGDFLGDLTDELVCYGPGSHITEFVSGGPKNYAYKVWCTNENREEIVCKVKGISLNHSASELVNFESIKKAVLEKSEPICILSDAILRTREHEVVTKETTKIYRPKSLKRKFAPDHSSLPYGYKKTKSKKVSRNHPLPTTP